MPIKLAATGECHRVTDTSAWLIMTPRHRPNATLRGHLTLALMYEGLDPAVLKHLFLTTGSEPIANWVSAATNRREVTRNGFGSFTNG